MIVQVILYHGNDVTEEHYLKSQDRIKRMSPGMIKFETEDAGPRKGKEVKRIKRTVIFSGNYSVSFNS